MELALSEGNLAVAFQPKVDLRANVVQGAEALLRYHESDLSPEEFIKLAEEMAAYLMSRR